MSKYTTITVRKELVKILKDLRKELKTRSLEETIMELIKYYRIIKAKQFSEEVKKAREEGLWIGTMNTVIRNMIMRNNYYGLILWNSTASELYNNFMDNVEGIYLWNSSKNNIYNNLIKNNDDGIRVEASNNNNIHYNAVLNNYITGIALVNSRNNSVHDNNINKE